jgi:hypothetical protein
MRVRLEMFQLENEMTSQKCVESEFKTKIRDNNIKQRRSRVSTFVQSDTFM